MKAKELNLCISRIASGDKSALLPIYNAYSDLIYKIAIWITKSSYDANDIMQEFFRYVLEYAATIKYIKNPKAWIAVSTRNNAVRLLSKKSRNKDINDPKIEKELACTYDIDLQIAISDSKALLNEVEGNVFELHYVQGYTTKEVAKILNRHYVTVLKDVYNIREKLDHLKK